MAEIQIEEAHKPLLARAQHVLEWLQGEQQRLQGELAQVLAAGKREQEKLVEFVRQAYGVQLASIDADKGVITAPDPAPASEPESPFLNRE